MNDNDQNGPERIRPGRKRKYQTDEERKEARRLQNRAYRERKRKALEELRRAEHAQSEPALQSPFLENNEQK